MIRLLVILSVIATGCDTQTSVKKPAATSTNASQAMNTTIGQDSFHLAINDVRANDRVAKRVFTILVPTSSKRIRVSMGSIEQGASWSLSLLPSAEEERVCSFEVSQPVVELKQPNQKSVTVNCKLVTPKASTESPLSFTVDETNVLEDVISYDDTVTPGLHKQNTPVVLVRLKMGTPEAVPLVLFVSDEDSESAK